MDANPESCGELTGKIYKRMMLFLDKEGADVKPVDVVRWWAFWEAVVPSDLNPGRLFWTALVTMMRMSDDSEKSAALFRELGGWLIGDDYVSVEIVHLDDDSDPPWD